MSSANELQQQGIKLFQQRDYEAAAERFRQAQAAYEAEDAPDMAAEMMVNIGLVHRALGEHELALDMMQNALAFFSEQGDQMREAQVLGNMGGVYAAQGDREQATTCYRQAADVFHELGEEELYGQTLIALGDLQVKSGQIMSGAATYEVGLDSVKALSGTQKVLKGLLGIRRRLTGVGAPPIMPGSVDDEDDGSEE
ncbi:MAG: tetratricopeptide repeat protein [Anaerolineae bacterium]|nr:tetratricopeptide repeat protein [Anaerolineae bacterium]